MLATEMLSLMYTYRISREEEIYKIEISVIQSISLLNLVSPKNTLGYAIFIQM